ncbi:response regulator transcription factor [Sphingobium boeckii]|uniref:DNA-binding response OmpR family regulator n=1 Tax=Sphingobium boeckii TaxID=1082345 RepID=A0A7W9ALK2_9SPHN|nr:response regulator [Sphingobium boeckii]MBB5687672.1 DNA-binding response OmpR family regulator [Sphingobium boeckii]
MRIALISDNPHLARLVEQVTAGRTSLVNHLRTSECVPANIGLSHFDLVILDLCTSRQQELNIVSEIRRRSLIGIILFTEYFSREERIAARKAGACNLLEKPVHVEELNAALANISYLSNTAMQPREADRGKAWVLDLESQSLVAPAGQVVPLSSAELAVLEPLFRQTHTPMKREDLHGFRRNWTPTSSRSLDVVISKLRSKVELEIAEPFPLRSARGIGYIFVGTARLIARQEAIPAAL